jgi:hypothetical protein
MANETKQRDELMREIFPTSAKSGAELEDHLASVFRRGLENLKSQLATGKAPVSTKRPAKRHTVIMDPAVSKSILEKIRQGDAFEKSGRIYLTLASKHLSNADKTKTGTGYKLEVLSSKFVASPDNDKRTGGSYKAGKARKARKSPV